MSAGGAPGRHGAALVTGASSGIGEAFARELAAVGVDLVLVARRAAPLERLAAELAAAHGVRVDVRPADLAERDAVASLVDNLAADGTDVGLLVANAGIGNDGRSFAETPLARMLAMIDLHCRANVELVHRLLPPMLERGAGGIVVTASIAGFQPTPSYAVYGASKAFDLLFAEALWAELRGTGVDVLALAPGLTDTAFFDAAGRPGAGRGAMSARRVAREALARLGRGGPTHVPGLGNRLLTLAPRLATRARVARALARVLGERGGRERSG